MQSVDSGSRDFTHNVPFINLMISRESPHLRIETLPSMCNRVLTQTSYNNVYMETQR